MVHGRRWRLALLPAVLLPAAACLFPSLDDVSGSSDGSFDGASEPVADAPTEAEDAAPLDASEASVSPCADGGAHYFCADFDGPNPLSVWAEKVSGGSCSIDGSDSHSPPDSLLCQTSATAGNTEARLQHGLPSGTTSVHADFWVKLDPAACSVSGANSYLELFKLNGASGYGLGLWVRGGNLALNIDQTSLTPILAAPCDTWTELTLDVVFSTTAGSVKVAVNGVTGANVTPVNTLKNAENQFLLLGLYASQEDDGGAPAPMSARFDNLVVDVTQ